MSKLVPLEDVHAALRARAKCIDETETVSLTNALNRICAEDIASRIDVPPDDNSAMDGYALALTPDEKTADRVFPVSDRIVAGSVGSPLAAGKAARIFTGAGIPPGANTVVKQEDTSQESDGIRINVDVATGENIRPRGQDIKAGSRIMECGTRIAPQHLGLLASVGRAEVETYRPLRVAIIATGSELIQPPTELRPGQIYNSNSYLLAGLIHRLGMEPVQSINIGDDPQATRDALVSAAGAADCVVTSGGVSVGDEDYVKTAVEEVGHLDLWRIAIRPGKPVAFGSIGETPFFGLPGNPVSCFVTFLIVARPYLIAMQGCSEPVSATYHARADFDYPSASVCQFIRVRVDSSETEPTAVVFPNQSSGVLSSLTWANALAEIDADQAVRKGDVLKIHPL